MEILKSEIFIVVYEKKEGVSFEEFGGLFRRVHGYNLNLSKYGYSSLKMLLNEMTDLVELKTINRQQVIRCKSPSSHHVVVSYGNNSTHANEQVSGVLSPSSGPSPVPVVRKTKQAQHTPLQQNHVKVKSTKANSATDKKPKETSKSKEKNHNLPSKNTSAVSQKNSPPPLNCGSSLIGNSAATSTKSHSLSASLTPPISKPPPANPAGNVTVAATKKNAVSKTRQELNSISSNPNSKIHVPALQNVKSAKTRVIESKTFSAATEPNRKAGLLPVPKTPLTSGPVDFNCMSHVAQPGIQPKMSYAAACASNVNNGHFNHSSQQFTSSNIRFNPGAKVNSTSINQSYSREEPQTSVHSSSVIKENIQLLVSQHADGLSVFHLQKLYLFTFRQPLKFKSSITLKRLLLELKDVVKTEGVGVQTLVFPVSAENHTITAGNGDHENALQEPDSLFTKKDFQEEVVLNPHSSDALKTENDKLQKATILPLHDDLILASGWHSMDPLKGYITKKEKIENKTSSSMQNVKNISGNEQRTSPREELSVSVSNVRDLPKHANEKPQQYSSSSVKNQKSKNDHQEEHSCKTAIPKETISKNTSSQYVNQVILHSSGFSVVMGQQIDGPRVKENLADPAGCLKEKMTPCDVKSTKGPGHLQPMQTNSNVNVFLQGAKPQLSVLHIQNDEHILLQPLNSMNTKETSRQTESPALPPKVDSQFQNNCNISEYPPLHSIDGPQSETVLVQMEKLSSIGEHISHNSKEVKQVAYLSSNVLKKHSNSQFVDNVSGFLSAPSNEEAPAVLTKIEKTSQQEANVLSTPSDLEETKASVSSDDLTAIKIRNINQNKPTFPTQRGDEFTIAEKITQTHFSSSKPGHEIVDPFPNIPKQPEISVAQSELHNDLESTSEQEDMNTWQTSQGQVCCIL